MNEEKNKNTLFARSKQKQKYVVCEYLNRFAVHSSLDIHAALGVERQTVVGDSLSL